MGAVRTSEPGSDYWKGAETQMKKRAPSKRIRSAPPQLLTSDRGSRAKSDITVLTPLNFKVPAEFHRDFKTFAAQHSKKMVEVLQEAFALLKESNGR